MVSQPRSIVLDQTPKKRIERSKKVVKTLNGQNHPASEKSLKIGRSIEKTFLNARRRRLGATFFGLYAVGASRNNAECQCSTY